jgi:hypothetical protein
VGLVDEFACWLKQWYSDEEVEAMLDRPWQVEEGVKLRGKVMMGIEEFLRLAAVFAVDKALNVSGVDYIVKLVEVCAFHVQTRTLVAFTWYRPPNVNRNGLERFLNGLVDQAKAAGEIMALRRLVL